MKEKRNRSGKHEHPLPGKIDPEQKKKNADALSEAEKDMENDPDLKSVSKNADLDEGEAARLGEEDTGLV